MSLREEQKDEDEAAAKMSQFIVHSYKKPAKDPMRKAYGTDIKYPYIKEIEDGFLGGYGEMEIHNEMLEDKPRREAYRRASINNC